MPKISVIIPTYNRSRFIKEAVDSALQQTYTDLEVLVVDDGSTDDTRFVIEGISDPRVGYYYKENGGQSSARNLGLIHAKGEYIVYLDADDLLPRGYLEVIIGQLEAHGEYGATYVRVIKLHPDGRKEELSTSERYRSGWVTKYFFELSPSLLPSSTCFRKSTWDGLFWDEAITRSSDYDVFLRISTKIQFLYVPNTFVIKRAMPDSLSRAPDITGPISRAYILERFYFHLGGDKYVPLKAAKRKISHRYRKAARLAGTFGNKYGAILLFRKAISYYPWDIRLYFNLLSVLLKSKSKEIAPGWDMPCSLPSYITVSQKP